ncbi:DUF1365 domain-containing protein [uncultured Alsobacter sp.]|uniref:DUF1365 domain-containing protein n=1 Tax=uncultured Alsobacter sp. TaxID=1748258 RepID=UPI0025E0AD29|nr:DUF1365 domain-containing protein [uncultured Alsobacter sp.]
MSSASAGHLFPPPDVAAALVRGTVMHARLKPVGHRFSYEVFSLLIDLGRLKEADRISPLFGVNRAAPVSFRESDHGPRDGSSLFDHVAGVLAPAGIDLRGGRVLLQCYPRILGTVFNPLSVYFAYGADGALKACVYEVRNTFGQNHTYVAPVQEGELTEAGLRQERGKLFYVSPFNGMEMRYRFRVRPPTRTLAIRILETDPEGPLLAASFIGSVNGLTTTSLLAALGAVPLLTAKVVGGIHWEALKLWLKGLRPTPRPEAPPALSYGEPGLQAPRRS